MLEVQDRPRRTTGLSGLVQSDKALIWGGLTGITLLALVLRLWQLDRIPMVWDEVFNYNIARMDIPGILKTVAGAIEPPLFYFLLRLWTLVTGGAYSEFNARILTVLIGTIGVPLSYWFFSKVVRWQFALLGALFVAVSGYQLYYSQYAKNYIMITTLGFLSLALFMDIIATPRAKWYIWAGWAATSVALIYTHYFSAFLLLGQGLVLFVFFAWGRIDRLYTLKMAAIVAVGAGLAYLPWLGTAIHSLQERYKSPGFLYYALDDEFFSQQFYGLPNLFIGLPVEDFWLWIGGGFALLTAVAAIAASWYNARRAPNNQAALQATTGTPAALSSKLIALGLLLPALTLPYFVVMLRTKSQIETKNYLGYVGCVIFALLLVGFQRIWNFNRLVGAIFVLVMLTLNVMAARQYYTEATHGDDYRALARELTVLRQQYPQTTLLVPIGPVEDMLRFYSSDQDLQGLARLPNDPERYPLPSGGVILVADYRFYEADWNVKYLRGALERQATRAQQFDYPGCQIQVWLPKK